MSPYKIQNDIGGDSPENMKFMENCVKKVKGKKGKDGKPIDEGGAIAICKTSLKKAKSDISKAKFIINTIIGE